MIRSKKQMYMAISAFALILLLVGTTVAFFNYTRTGTANTIRTGRIAFNTEQGDTVTLSDLFPIQNTGNITSATPGVGSLSIHVTGDTTYENGLEYIVKAVNVTSASTGNELPISIEISYEANGQGKTVGEEDEDYFDNRGGNSSIYKLLSTNTITDGGDILVGYIASGSTGIDGNINIIAYLDAANIAITDTIEDGDIEVPGYTNGTDTDWINGRTVFTTEEWNQLQANGVSFQVKVEANEGIWVEAPAAPVVIPTIPSCPGCKFIHTTNTYYYTATNSASSPISTLTTFANNNDTLVDDYTALNKNSFLGFKFNGSGVITNAYVCGIKGTDYLNNEEQNPGVNAGTPFCIEGSTDGSTYTANSIFLNDSTTGIWQGRCDGSVSRVDCSGSVGAGTQPSGLVYVGDENGDCVVDNDGSADCYLW